MDLLELARSFDPYNDRIYCDIMRMQARLGHVDAITRTLGLLRTRLAEIRERPAAATITLATALTDRARTTPIQPANGSASITSRAEPK